MIEHKNILTFSDKPFDNVLSWNKLMEAYTKIYRMELGKVKNLDELEIFHNQLAVKKLNGSHDFKVWVDTINKFCESWLRLAVF